MFRRFSLRDVTRAFPATAFERGRRYFEEGRVRHLDVKEPPGGILVVRGEVLGSGGRSYVQEVDLEWNGDVLDVFSTCSCPVAFDCKHVVAVCLMVRRYLSGGGSDEADTMDARLRRWLGRVDRAGVAKAAGESTERLMYVLLPREERAAGLGVELRLVRPRKGGGVTKGRLLRLDRAVDETERPEAMCADDDEVVRLLGALCPEIWDLRPEFRGRLGFMAIERLLATGRCSFESADREPLTWGDARPLDLTWRESEDGRLVLDVSAGPASHVLATDPALYLDPERDTVGRLDSSLRPEQVGELLAAPALLAGDAAALARLLTNEFPRLALPVPADAQMAEAEHHPLVPCLTLAGGQHGDDSHELRLAFSYGGRTVQARPETLQSVADGPSGPVRLHRDLEAEARALERLTALGFTCVAAPGPVSEVRLVEVGGDVVESVGRWSVLVQDVVPQLEREGWRICEEDGFDMHFSPGTWHGEATPANGGNDWFSLRFDLEVDGERMPLLPLLMPLLELGLDRPLPARISLPVGLTADGGRRYVDLPRERLAPFLEMLHDLFDNGRWQADRTGIDITRFDAAVTRRLQQAGTPVVMPAALEELGSRLADFTGIRRVPPPCGLRAELRGYQRRGLDWLQFLREYQLGGILADDMGLGKTLQVLAHLLAEKNAHRLDRPALVVAPTSLMGNWRREAERFTPGLTVLVLHGPGRRADFERIAEHDLVLTTYPLLPRDRSALQAHAYHSVILDEAQMVKNPRAKAAAVVRALDARHRLCLTGTPIENHLGEIWTQFDFLLPGFLGDAEQFHRHWRRPIEEQGDAERHERLARRIAPFVLRRRKDEVLEELPPKTEILRTVALGDRQAALYESVRLAMDEKVRRAIAAQGLARSHITILDALLKLRQICCDPRLVPLEAAREVKSSAKLELLMQLLPPMLEEGRRVLLFSQFTSMLSLIEHELKRHGLVYSILTGQTRDRDAVLDHFRGGTVNLLLVSLKAGGVGLNLTEADTVILYDPWWNPAVEAQAAGRAHRIGQTRAVFVYRLVTEGTVEEKILALQARKQALADGVLAGRASRDGAAFDADDLRALFS